MEKWREICGQQAARLKSALDLCKHASALVNHGSVRQWVKDEDVKALNKTRKMIENKLPRLERGEFHIAVVGMEKSGKSSFINAWIGSDLLPNKKERCTFTTTKLHSVMRDDEQRLEVRPKTQEEFDALIEQLKTLINSPNTTQAKNAREDLELIKQYNDQLRSLVGQEIEPIHYRTLEDISPDLEKYAADARYAHAISEVDLYTKSLANMDGILFYDVPGIDSGLEKHKVETQRMLQDSDAVIMVKKFGEPSIKDAEQDILDYVKTGDESVSVRDKLFIFYSRIDDEKTREGFVELAKKNIDECVKYGIDDKKVVFGAAAAVLQLEDKLKDTRYIKPKPELKKDLVMLLDLPDDKDETVKAAAGIKELREKLDTYLQTERERILRKSCDDLIQSLEHTARNIHEVVRARVPDNPEDMIKSHNRDLNRAFNSWFSGLWEQVLAETARDNSDEIVQESLKTMEQAYTSDVGSSIDSLEHYQPDKREQFFDSIKMQSGSDDLERQNSQIREKINEEIINKMQGVASRLSIDLYTKLMKYMDGLSKKFNDSIDLEEMLLKRMDAWPKEYYKKQLESAMSALFLRYARPLARALMQHRHGIPARREEALKNAGAFFALSNYYSDDSPEEFAELMKYLTGQSGGQGKRRSKSKGGAQPSNDELFRKIFPSFQESGPEEAPSVSESATGDVAGLVKPNYASRQDVIDELEKDHQALKAYMSDSVFKCSGIADYADSERDRIQRIFNRIHDEIRSDVQTEYMDRNPKIMSLVPEEMRQSECDTRIADLLQQLTLSLQNRV